MRADGPTDVTKLIVAFRNFANAPDVGFCALAALLEVVEYKMLYAALVSLLHVVCCIYLTILTLIALLV